MTFVPRHPGLGFRFHRNPAGLANDDRFQFRCVTLPQFGSSSQHRGALLVGGRGPVALSYRRAFSTGNYVSRRRQSHARELLAGGRFKDGNITSRRWAPTAVEECALPDRDFH